MTSVVVDPARCYREVDRVLDELVGAWNRADVAARPDLPLPPTARNTSLVIEWRRLTCVDTDLVVVDMAWSVRTYPGGGERPHDQRSGLSSLTVTRRESGWAIDPVEIPAA